MVVKDLAEESTTEEEIEDSSESSENSDSCEDEIYAPHSYRPEGILTATRTLSGLKSKTKGYMTPNIKALVLTAFLFTLITVLQLFAARIARSEALLMDCVSMGVDALTYMGNIAVECRKRDALEHKGSQLIVCAISLSCLLYFTYASGQESLATVQQCRRQGASTGDDDVNGYITLGFGVGGFVFDMIAMFSFSRSKRKSEGEARPVNMFTALLHVAADFLRSTSTIVMSLLILVGGFDSTCLDAYTSLLIGISIIAGACVGIFQWIGLAHEYFCTGVNSHA